MGNLKADREQVSAWVEAQMPALIEMLTEICRIRSVAEVKDAKCKPFGEGCIEVLNKMLQIGQEEGFETRNFDNYVGSITYPGKTKENIGIWAHLDVVDEGKDWDFSPYEPTVKNGYMVARGCNDNKSSAAIALFALKYMKEHNIQLNHTLELYAGTCEEQGMYDIDYFVEHYECPTLSLVPDSGFPVCCGERGSFNGELKYTKCCEDLLDVKCGDELYTVPEKAEAVLRFTEERWLRCALAMDAELKADGCQTGDLEETGKEIIHFTELTFKNGVRVFIAGDELHIEATGISTQASIPESGDNALTKLAGFICEHQLLEKPEVEIFEMVCRINNATHDGSGLNVFCRDEMSGPMKLVATKLNFVGEEGKENDTKHPVIEFISKYPFSKNDFPYEENARKVAEDYGFELKVTRLGKATFFNPDRPVVERLTDCCNEVLGTNDKPFVMSGGTYARKLPNALAFGSGMRVPKAPEGMFRPGHGSYHQPDESISLERVQKALEVYIHAILAIDDMDLTE